MIRLPTELPGLVRIAPDVRGDERGFLVETYRADELAALGMRDTFVQDNHARSTRGVLRGLHFQTGAGQAKLVRAARGAVWDVVVDIRRSSHTFGRHEVVVLDDQEHPPALRAGRVRPRLRGHDRHCRRLLQGVGLLRSGGGARNRWGRSCVGALPGRWPNRSSQRAIAVCLASTKSRAICRRGSASQLGVHR
jgi:hypothetical protein